MRIPDPDQSIPLSIVIVNWNAGEHLRACLATLEACTDEDFEVFVVDNDSSDGSVERLRPLFDGVRWIELEHNVGFAKACNVGLELSRGRHLLLLNPDTLVPRGTLSRMTGYLDDNPDVGIVGCRVLDPDGTLQAPCRRTFPTPAMAFYKEIGLARLFPKSPKFARHELTFLPADGIQEVDAVSGSFLTLRREVLSSVSGLDERFFLNAEDLDFCYRVKAAGWKIIYVGDVFIVHHRGACRRIRPVGSIRQTNRALRLYYDKHLAPERSAMVNSAVRASIWLRERLLVGISAAAESLK